METVASDSRPTASHHPLSTDRARKRSNLVESDRKVFQCNECSSSFVRKTALTIHSLRQHPTEKPYKCQTCPCEFEKKRLLKMHMVVTHNIEPSYICRVCKATFAHQVSLNVHTRTAHQGKKPYKCEVCDHCFAQKGNMKTHMRLHTGERPYSCPDCDKAFIQLNNLQTHIRSSHIAPHLARDRPSRRNVQERCEHCNAIFSNKKTLLNHVSYMHSLYVSRKSERLKKKSLQQFAQKVSQQHKQDKVEFQEHSDERESVTHFLRKGALFQSNGPTVAPKKNSKKRHASDIQEEKKTRKLKKRHTSKFKKYCAPILLDRELQAQIKNPDEATISLETPDNELEHKTSTRKRRRSSNRCYCCNSNSGQAEQSYDIYNSTIDLNIHNSSCDKKPLDLDDYALKGTTDVYRCDCCNIKFENGNELLKHLKHMNHSTKAKHNTCNSIHRKQPKQMLSSRALANKCLMLTKDHASTAPIQDRKSNGHKDKSHKIQALKIKRKQYHKRKCAAVTDCQAMQSHQCKYCFAVFEERTDLLNHECKNFGKVNKSCKANTSNKNRGLQHRTHGTDNGKKMPYRCNLCMSEFMYLNHLTSHVRIMHNPFNKLNSQNAIKQELDLQNSETNNITSRDLVMYKCEQCTAEFELRCHLLNHVRLVHRNSMIVKLPNQDSAKKRSISKTVNSHSCASFKCEHCNGQYQSQGYLHSHIRRMHSTKRVLKVEVSKVSRKKKSSMQSHDLNKSAQYKCAQCNAQYKHERNLVYHVRLMHGIGKLPPASSLPIDLISKQPILKNYKSKEATIKCEQYIAEDQMRGEVDHDANLSQDAKTAVKGMNYYNESEALEKSLDHLQPEYKSELEWPQTPLKQIVEQDRKENDRKSDLHCCVKPEGEFEPESTLEQIHDEGKEQDEYENTSYALKPDHLSDAYMCMKCNLVQNYQVFPCSSNDLPDSKLTVGLLNKEVEQLSPKQLCLQCKLRKDCTEESKALYNCDQCKAEFWHRRSLLRHVRINHVSVQLYECDTCKNNRQESLLTGQRIVGNQLLNCSKENLCDSPCKETIGSAVEVGVLTQPVCNSETRVLQHTCGKCHVTFAHRGDLHQHLLGHAAERG